MDGEAFGMQIRTGERACGVGIMCNSGRGGVPMVSRLFNMKSLSILITPLSHLEIYNDTQRAGVVLPFFLRGSCGNYFCVHDCVININSSSS